MRKKGVNHPSAIHMHAKSMYGRTGLRGTSSFHDLMWAFQIDKRGIFA